MRNLIDTLEEALMSLEETGGYKKTKEKLKHYKMKARLYSRRVKKHMSNSWKQYAAGAVVGMAAKGYLHKRKVRKMVQALRRDYLRSRH